MLGMVLDQQIPMHPCRCLPAVAAAPHPVVIIPKGHHAHAVLLASSTARSMASFALRGPNPVAVPPLNGSMEIHRLQWRRNQSSPYPDIHHPGEAVHTVGIYAVQAIV